jgi:hypothetical protein
VREIAQALRSTNAIRGDQLLQIASSLEYAAAPAERYMAENAGPGLGMQVLGTVESTALRLLTPKEIDDLDRRTDGVRHIGPWGRERDLMLAFARKNGLQVGGQTREEIEFEGGGHGVAGFIKPDTPTRVFFYEQDFYVLSNFSAFQITFENRANPAGDWTVQTFETSEQCYHFLKFDHLAGRGVQDLIWRARSAHEAFKLAQEHKALQRPDWDEIKVNVMKRILRAKVDQHAYVRRKLLATGDRELIEDSWRDDFWGWGPNRDGQNMLGKLWMQVRAELRGWA